ncbi:hypothetical protein [Microtetraspora niveoalba]|uniref:hypothetical protein n=1 Tax=Microtetraspora niveoalba TaxID=46175 RepID=UPI00082D070B|nr:hypothetical protein [Microtetraspora niveoalba]
MTPLERRYRRLLAWYPEAHREQHEEEMIAVLLAGADPGQDRPTARDTLDLLRGGLAIRLRHAVGPGSRRHWRAALNITAFIPPLVLFLMAIFRAGALAGRLNFDSALGTLASALPYGLILLLTWRKRPKAAAACAWGWTVVAALILLNLGVNDLSSDDMVVSIGVSMLPNCVCAAMLTFAPSPGPAPLGAPRLLTWTAIVLATLVAGRQVSLAWGTQLPFVVLPVVVLVVAAVRALRSSIGRRAVITVLPFLGVFLPKPGVGGLAMLATLAPLSVTILAVTAWLARTDHAISRSSNG